MNGNRAPSSSAPRPRARPPHPQLQSTAVASHRPQGGRGRGGHEDATTEQFRRSARVAATGLARIATAAVPNATVTSTPAPRGRARPSRTTAPFPPRTTPPFPPTPTQPPAFVGSQRPPAPAASAQVSSSSVRQVTKAFSAIKLENGGGIPKKAPASAPAPAVSSTARGHDSNNNLGLPEATTPKIAVTSKTSTATATSQNSSCVLPNSFILSEKPPQPPRKSERMADSHLLRNFDPGTCQFCSVPLQAQDGIMVDSCLHLFCKECLQSAIEMQRDSAQIPCPLQCSAYLTDAEVKELVTPQVFQEYLERSLVIAKKKMKNVFSCKTPGCSSWCEFEQGRKTFYCPTCGQDNCMICDAIHVGVDCATFTQLKSQGQLGKVQEIVEKERKNGWAQLTAMMNATTSPSGGSSGGDGTSMEEILTKTDLLQNQMEFECSICYGDIPPGEGVILHECLHMFCKECLINLVEHGEETSVRCPYIDGNYSCVNFVQAREIKALVPQATFDKHLQRSLKLGEANIENSFHCKTPDCPGWTVFEQGDTRFRCPNCQKVNCIPCEVLHEGTCEDYKNRVKQNENDKLSEQAVEELINKGEYMRCPKCKIPVKKAVGCDWLQCSVCRTEICWITRGPRWGPKGKGDISGGCRCRVNGKKCHPRCGNCH